MDLVYNFTLVHGDVQAARPEAQSRPSIWWVWGPAQAINAGDGLHALGRTTIMRLAQRGVSPQRVLSAVESLDRACLALCEGQYLDLDFQDRIMVTSSAYFDMIAGKTGALAACSAESGALAAGAEEAVCGRFKDLGSKLGMAWQITRDVTDLWGSQGDGMTASNVLSKKKSLPLIHVLETADVATKRELGNIYMKRVLEAEDAGRLVSILDRSDAREFSEQRAAELVQQALGCVEGVEMVEGGLSNLRALVQQMINGTA